MRLILLLSALLTAFAGSGVPARATGVSAAQVSALVERRAARGEVVAQDVRPGFVMPSVGSLAAAPAYTGAAVVRVVPLYGLRLRI